jgi:hypothetical protein
MDGGSLAIISQNSKARGDHRQALTTCRAAQPGHVRRSLRSFEWRYRRKHHGRRVRNLLHANRGTAFARYPRSRRGPRMIAIQARIRDGPRRARSRSSKDIVGQEVFAPVPGRCGSCTVHNSDARRHSDDADDCKPQVLEIAVSTPRHFPHPQSFTNDSQKSRRVFGETGAGSMGCAAHSERPAGISGGRGWSLHFSSNSGNVLGQVGPSCMNRVAGRMAHNLNVDMRKS